MSSSSRPILALSFMLTVASATAAAQRQELASAVATNNAEVRILVAQSISGAFGTASESAMLAGADMEVWINARGRPDSLRYHAPLVDRSYYPQVMEAEVWWHGVFPPATPGWYRWRLAFDIAHLAPKGEEATICPTQKALSAVLELVLRSKAQGLPPDSGIQVELRPTILGSPHCDGILARTVAAMRTQPSSGGAEICLEAECSERPSRRVSFSINLTELKWFTTSWKLSTSDGIWYIDCPVPKLENDPQLGRCRARRHQVIW